MLSVVDETTRECLALVVDTKLNSTHVLETLLIKPSLPP